jgi:N-acetylneuraminate synthase
MKISNLKLDDLSHTFVIAEAGSNWKYGTYKQDLNMAKKLINTAVNAGADAVKFQTYRAETVYVPNAGPSGYLSKSGIKKDITEIFTKLSMPYEMLDELEKYCMKKNIVFMSTPFSVSDAKEVDKHVKIHKVASYEINHVRLLEFLAKTRKPIIVSTGASNYEEIDFAIKTLRKNGAKNIILMQCTSKYPAILESLNLRAIPEMKKRYKIPIGLSDHSIDPIIAPLMAIGLGATIIEKHFTINKKAKGPDHKFALEPDELSAMISAIRLADKTKGNGIKKVLNEEKELRKYAVRSVQAIRKIKKGQEFVEDVNVAVLRPGNRRRGADARFLTKITGRRSRRDIGVGDGILPTDCFN